MLDRAAIFTNTGMTADGQPWWEGLPGQPAFDWRGREFDPASGPAAHPNSRFTVSARQCPSASPEAENPAGVPISAIVFGGRRAGLVPLVMEAESWTHGVLMGASMASETTAAATGAVGIVRRDPMAMKPFCGYSFADYFRHWLSFDRADAHLPKMFHVNWFRKGADGTFLWPGFGENMRVLEWIFGRCEGTSEVRMTPVGGLPPTGALRLEGLDLSADTLEQLLSIDAAAWRTELGEVAGFLREFDDRAPAALLAELERRKAALSARVAA